MRYYIGAGLITCAAMCGFRQDVILHNYIANKDCVKKTELKFILWGHHLHDIKTIEIYDKQSPIYQKYKAEYDYDQMRLEENRKNGFKQTGMSGMGYSN